MLNLNSVQAKKNYTIKLFIIVYVFYVIWYPFLSVLYPGSHDLTIDRPSFNLYYLYVILLLLIVPVSRFLSKITFNNVKYTFPRRNITTFHTLTLIFLSIILILLINKFQISSSTLFNRLNREAPGFETQLWVFFVIVSQAIIFTSIFYFEQLSKIQILLLFAVIVLFIFLEVFLFAGRRYSLAIVFFTLYKYNKVNKLFSSYKGVLLFIVFISIGIVLGIAREIIINPSIVISGDFNSFLDASLNANEFNEISRSIFYMVDELKFNNLKFGSTYFDVFLIFIPRVLFPNKPISFVFEYQTSASPMVEAYLNFGIFGFIPLLFLFIFIRKLLNNNNLTFFKGVIVAFSFDLFRSDFAAYVYCIVIILFVKYLITSKIRI